MARLLADIEFFEYEITAAEIALLSAGVVLTALLAGLIIVLWRRAARER
jgi:hypothetical protein